MARIVWVMLLAGLCAGNVWAQGVSEDYRRERERARFAKPHGFGFELDLFAHAPYFEQQQKVRAHGVDGNRLSYRGDFGGTPFGVFLDLDIRARFTWWDSIEFGYGFAVLRAFDDFKEPAGFNGTEFPADVDGDYGADFHDFHLLYRRDLFRIGGASEFAFFIQAGLEWAVLTASLDSDDVPSLNKRSREHFRELLPWSVGGLGFEWRFNDHFRLRADGFGGYQAGMPTLQKRADKSVAQSVTSITGRALFEWRPVSYFAVLVGGQYRYLRARLVAGFRQDNFLWWSVGPEVGVGFRF